MTHGEATGWIPVSDLQIGFNENKLPATDKLVGRKIDLFLDDSRIIKMVFQSQNRLTWETHKIPEQGLSRPDVYEAMEITRGLFFVDFVKKKETRSSVTITLDLKKLRALVMETRIPARKDADSSFLKRISQGLNLSPTVVEIHQANVDKPYQEIYFQPFRKTKDLIGKIVQYTYSRQHTYEHYYMNRRFYAWQCLHGPEKGTADADFCDYFKIAPHIYQFIWREKVVPTVGIVLIDFKTMRSNGKIFGLDIQTGKAINFTMGAFVKLIKE